MKKITNQFYVSHVDRMKNGRGKFLNFALFPLMLFMLLLLPTRMVAQTEVEYDNTITFTALKGYPQGMSEAENFKKLFDGKKTEGNSSKWCCYFYGGAYVIFEASKAGVPVGYTITTGNDNEEYNCRNPLSWKLYGNNTGKDDAWTLIDEVSDDKVLKDENNTSYDFKCECSTSYKYFKWEISAIHSGGTMQVGEFELKLNTCSHKKADGSSALGAVINTIDPTCAEHGYTTHECSLCHSTVKVYKDDELKAHTLTHHEATSDIKEHWQCDVCHKYFSDSNATQEVTYGSLLYQAYAMFDDATETLTFSYGTKPKGAYVLNEGASEPGWLTHKNEIKEVVFDASFACARPTSCYYWFCGCSKLTGIEGIENLNTENVTNMNSMFDRCSALTLLDLTNFNTAKVSDMSYMFMGCSALTTIFVSDKFVTDQVTSSNNMFHMCINLIGAIEYDGSKSDHTYANYENGYFSPEGGFHAYAEFDGTETLTFRRGLSKPEGAYDLNEGRNLPDWNNLGTNVKKVVFDASFASARPTNCYGWFKDFTNLTTIEGFEYLNTENVTNMTGVFNGCSALTSLDLTNFNTAKVTDMKLLFANCSALESLDLSMFNTENVTSMPSMFNGATNLKTLNVSNFNTEKVNNMGHMFANCPNLTSLDLSSFNTKGVEYVDNIFKNCSNLTTIYASEIFAFGSGLKNGANMFLGCDKLKGFIEYNKNTDKNNSEFANYKTGYFTKLVGKNGDEKIGAAGETLATDNLVLADDKDFVAYEPFAAKTASYSRTMKAGTTWATLCLPFEVSLDGRNFRAFKLLSADDATETVELEEVKTIEAGTPVIIKMTNGATELDFSVANKNIAKDVQTSKTSDGNYQLQGLYTQKMFSKDVDNNCYIVKGNKLMNPAKLLENTKVTKVASKPFRAYMVDNTSAAAGAKMFSIGFNDNTTAIENLNTITNDKAVYYDIQGIRLNAPQKGINIVKRGNKTMKVIIK